MAGTVTAITALTAELTAGGTGMAMVAGVTDTAPITATVIGAMAIAPMAAFMDIRGLA